MTLWSQVSDGRYSGKIYTDCFVYVPKLFFCFIIICVSVYVGFSFFLLLVIVFPDGFGWVLDCCNVTHLNARNLLS